MHGFLASVEQPIFLLTTESATLCSLSSAPFIKHYTTSIVSLSRKRQQKDSSIFLIQLLCHDHHMSFSRVLAFGRNNKLKGRMQSRGPFGDVDIVSRTHYSREKVAPRLFSSSSKHRQKAISNSRKMQDSFLGCLIFYAYRVEQGFSIVRIFHVLPPMFIKRSRVVPTSSCRKVIFLQIFTSRTHQASDLVSKKSFPVPDCQITSNYGQLGVGRN